MSRWERERPPNGEIARWARDHLSCPECGAGAGDRCELGGITGRSVHKERFIAGAIQLRHQWKEGRDLAAGMPACPATGEMCRCEAEQLSACPRRLAGKFEEAQP